mgnify:CR=1 FL=1
MVMSYNSNSSIGNNHPVHGQNGIASLLTKMRVLHLGEPFNIQTVISPVMPELLMENITCFAN